MSVWDYLELCGAVAAVLIIVGLFAAALFHICDLLDDDEFPEEWP